MRTLHLSGRSPGRQVRTTAWAAVVAASVAAPLVAQPGTGRVSAALRDDGPAAGSASARATPIVRAHRYRMAGKIRPLLAFWIGRDNVGGGSIVWRQDGGGSTGFELLMGSDPQLAPRGLNRWGYIAEEARGDRVSVIGIMTESDERSREEVEAGLDREGLRFKTVQTRIDRGVSTSWVSLVESPRGLTLHEAPDAVRLVRLDRSGSERTLTLDPGVRPGFLSSMAELLLASIESSRGLEGSRAHPRVVRYVHGSKVYVLTLHSERRLSSIQLGDRTYTDVVQGRFETKGEGRGDGARFELVYGTKGALAGVPVFIQYQPRWWLRVELVLND